MRKHTTHSHHIIPRHAGGTNDSTNLVELTVEEHAEAHKALYEQYGLLEDKLAWKGLVGLIDTAEIIYTLQSEGMKGDKNPMYGKAAPNRGIKRPGVGGRKKGTKWTDEERKSKELMRESKEHKDKMAAVYADPKRNKKISDGKKGQPGAAKNKRWFNNTVEEKYYTIGEEPQGWTRGRLNRK
jgi:hypothetical protein